jgi:hypothetical protein
MESFILAQGAAEYKRPWNVTVQAFRRQNKRDESYSMMYLVDMSTSALEYQINGFEVLAMKKDATNSTRDDGLHRYNRTRWEVRREGIIHGKEYQWGDYAIRVGARFIGSLEDSVMIEIEHTGLPEIHIGMKLINTLAKQLARESQSGEGALVLDYEYPVSVLERLFEVHGIPLSEHGYGFSYEHIALQHKMMI